MVHQDDIGLSLKILEAYTRDVGTGVARTDPDSMKQIKASEGDIIEIHGKRSTVGVCKKLYPSDEGLGIIRIDGLIRNNAASNIGDTVAIRKIKAIAAEKVVVAPLETIPPIDERYLTDALESVPLIKGDNVMVSYFGGRLTFQVIGVTPAADAVIVTQKTVFNIAERVPTMVEEQMQTLSGKIDSLIEKYDNQLVSLLEEQTVNEEMIIETYDKIKKLNEIIAYLSQKK